MSSRSTGSVASASNGSRAFAVPEHLTDPPSAANVDAAALHAVVEEIKLLSRHIDKAVLSRGSVADEDNLRASAASVAATNTLLDTLPDRIAKALGEALAEQHKMIMKDVDKSLRDFANRLQNPDVPPLTGTAVDGIAG